MRALRWWFIVVGAFYFLLSLPNLYAVLVDPGMMGSNFDLSDAEAQAFVDGWSPFAFEVFAIGTFMLWASRNPRRYLGAAWLLVWLELWHGIVDDVYLISRGYSAGGYAAFIVVHLVIIVTGILAARKAEAEAAPAVA